MHPQAVAVGLRVFFAALALGNDDVLFDEAVGRLVEGRLGSLEEACAAFAAQIKKPVLGSLARTREAVSLRALAMVLAVQVGRTLPLPTVFALVEAEVSAEQLDRFT